MTLQSPADQAVSLDAGAVPGADASARDRRISSQKDSGAEFSSAPLWFDWLAVIVISAVLSFGAIGLLLADVGEYSAVPVLLLGLLGTLGGTLLGRLRLSERKKSRRHAGTLPAILMCCVAIFDGVWNSLDASYHLLADRDPGLYLLAGKWIAAHGNLVVTGGTTWNTKGPFFQWLEQGIYPSTDGSTGLFHGNHFLPALIAEGQSFGGDRLMFRVPALLGAISLCIVYAVGCRLIRQPWLVLAAVTAFGLALPQVYVSRDAYSEIATEVLLWGGILLLMRRTRLERHQSGS